MQKDKKIDKKKWRKTVVKKLDNLVSEYVRLRDKKCVTCESLDQPTCGHFFSRVAYSTRWNLVNCYQQCWGCNLRHEHDPYPFTRFMLLEIGQEGIDALHYKFVHPVKYSTPQLLELCVELEAKLNELKSSLDNHISSN